MTIELWLAFVAASSVLLIVPGPTILAVISYSLAHGRQANAPLVQARCVKARRLTGGWRGPQAHVHCEDPSAGR